MFRPHAEHGVEAKLVKLLRSSSLGRAINLVHRQDRRHSELPDPLGHPPIGRNEALSTVDQHQSQVSTIQRPENPLRYLALEGVIAGAKESSSVDELETRTLPLDRLTQDIPGGARHSRHNRCSSTDDTIEKRRFPHIRSTDEDDAQE